MISSTTTVPHSHHQIPNGFSSAEFAAVKRNNGGSGPAAVAPRNSGESRFSHSSDGNGNGNGHATINGNGNGSFGEQSSVTENGLHDCEVCGDQSDGLHFGQFSCRACAAFFRRTVSLKLEYTCKRNRNCPIVKSARNMCRFCRYQKCLDRGLLPTAVQHMRDGLGKRTANNAKKHSADSSMPDMKIAKAGGTVANVGFNENSIMVATTSPTTTILSPHQQVYNQQQFQNSYSGHANGHGGGLYVGQSTITSANEFFLVDAVSQQLRNGCVKTNGVGQTAGPIDLATTNDGYATHVTQSYVDIGNTLTSPTSAFTAIQQNNFHASLQDLSAASTFLANHNGRHAGGVTTSLKFLSNMLEGYHHFLSLRKASYALIQGPLKFRESDEIPQSNFGTCKKLCRIEASLIMDTVEKFFVPFSTLSPNDKNLLFDSFYCLFSNTERAYRTYKTFGPADDRLLMPDGGYVRLGELNKFYENNSIVVGDPNQVAEIFKNAMEYVVKVVVTHMRRINLTEVELMALFGLFIWKDTEGLSPDGQRMVEGARDNIIVDLHAFYRTQGFQESEVTVKSANFLLLMPKLETSLKRLKDNFDIAELFNLMETGSCCMHLTSLMREDYEVAIMFELINVVEACPKLMTGLKIC